MWRGRRARAFVPARLADRDLASRRHHGTQRQGTGFGRAWRRNHAGGLRNALASCSCAEGVASSFIEGVTAPVVDIVLAEADDSPEPSAAAWVAANVAAVTEALEEAPAGPLSVESLRRWHRTLMTGSPTPAQHVGVLRTEQGWIGGTSPLDAHLVTPPPEYLPDLLNDLVVYVNRTDVDPVRQAAIAHAQSGIHPFTDGNGRVGRVLIAWGPRAPTFARDITAGPVPASPPTSAATARGSCCSASATTSGGCNGSPTASPAPAVHSRNWSPPCTSCGGAGRNGWPRRERARGGPRSNAAAWRARPAPAPPRAHQPARCARARHPVEVGDRRASRPYCRKPACSSSTGPCQLRAGGGPAVCTSVPNSSGSPDPIRSGVGEATERSVGRVLFRCVLDGARSEVQGMSMWVMPRWLSASTTALWMAGVDPMVPDSPIARRRVRFAEAVVGLGVREPRSWETRPPRGMSSRPKCCGGGGLPSLSYCIHS